jgi:hypothetical protein
MSILFDYYISYDLICLDKFDTSTVVSHYHFIMNAFETAISEW